MKTNNNGQQELAMMVNENFLNIFLYKQLMYRKNIIWWKSRQKASSPPMSEEISMIEFSLKLSLFKLGKVYKASGTRGRLFLDKSTSETQRLNSVKFRLNNRYNKHYIHIIS